MADYMPFGVGTPQEVGAQEPNVLDRMIAGIINGTVTLPKRVIDATQATAPGLRREDFTDIPGKAQPGAEMREGALEAAMMTMGATPFGMTAPRAGEVAMGAGPVRRPAVPEKPSVEPQHKSMDEWEAILAESKTRGQEANKILSDVLASPDQRAVFQSGNRRMSISKSLDPAYDLRVTHFDERGPSGHTEYKVGETRGLKDEIYRALVGGYQRVGGK